MREILFRGKEINKGNWIEGFLFPQNIDSGYCPLCICSSPISANDYSEILGDWSIVSEDTIGQYTGLTDMNGKKVFEGDIVKVTGLYPDRDGEKRIWRRIRVGEIFYYHGAFYFDKWLLCKTSEKCIEVIGNIHDNPELLEDKP